MAATDPLSKNPYPSGISVPGTGPNNSATNWATQWDPATGTFVANTGFGAAPIYSPAQYSSLFKNGQLPGLPGNEQFAASSIPTNQSQGPTGAQPTFNAGGDLLIHDPNDPGSQTVNYRLDPTTGDYIPSGASGSNNLPSAGWNAFGDFLQTLALAVPTAGFGSIVSGASAVPDFASGPVLDPSVFAEGAGAGAAGSAGAALPDFASGPTLDPSVFSEGAPGAGAGTVPDFMNGPTLDPSIFSAPESGGFAPIQLASLSSDVSGVGGVSGGLGDAGGGLSILPATGMSDVSSLDQGLADALGVATDSGVDPMSMPLADYATTPADIANFTPPGAGAAPQIPADLGGPVNVDQGSIFQQAGAAAKGAGSDALKWITGHPASSALTGLSFMNALKKPALPAAGQTALNNANALNPGAQATIQSGGTAAPQWAQQKSSIDAQINQQVQQLTEQLMQAQVNSGAGGGASVVTQQKIAQLKSTLETQRQQLYQAAQAQNVAQAIQVMSGNNQVLLQTAQMQMQQSQEAMAAAMQTAELALILAGGGSPSLKLG